MSEEKNKEITGTTEVLTPTEVKPVQDETLDRRTLFVRSIPLDATNEQLTDFFSQFAPVRHAVIVNDKEQNSRGFGFVSFTSDDDTVSALEKAKKEKFNGTRLLRIDIAKRRERKSDAPKIIKPRVSAEKTALKKTARIIVRNLPWSVRKPEELVEVFKKYGPVKEARIPKKKDGKMCGFAFVTMAKHSAAEKVVKGSEGLKINGREVAVDYAVDKSNWETIKKDEEKEEEINEGDEKEEGETNIDDNENKDPEDKIKEREVKDDNKNIDGDDDKDNNNDDDMGDDDNVDSDEEDAKLLELDDLGDDDNRPKKNRQERYCVFVRNLPYDVTEQSLTEHFEKLGPIKYALPVMDRETGLPKGTAFIAFAKNESYEECLLNAPEVTPNSVLIPDDVSPFYVFEGRVMQVAPAVDRDSAARLTEKSANMRKEMLGRLPKEKDRRNLYLLNEGRITENSKLAALLTKADLDVRERSYNLRLQQLNKNPSLHLSMTRLAIRNIPRAMNEKSLKALGRKAIVQFATEVKEGKRHPLSKEELDRSTKHKDFMDEKFGLSKDEEKKRTKKLGVVTQSKIINEVKGSGEYGRSKGYGFLEFKDHRCALMALRWLNAHEVTIPEIVEGLTPEQKKLAQREKLIRKKRLLVEFAVENAQVIKRRIEQVVKGRISNTKHLDRKRRIEESGESEEGQPLKKKYMKYEERKERSASNKRGAKKGNMNKGPNVGKRGNKSEKSKEESKEDSKPAVSEEVKRIISQKRKKRKSGK